MNRITRIEPVSCYGVKQAYNGYRATSSKHIKNWLKGRVVCFESLAGRDAGVEPTGKYSRRFSKQTTRPGMNR